jgi:hypothetical protein
MNTEYLTTRELSERIKYDERYIRENLKDKVLKKGLHYIKPFGGRKILYLWEAVKEAMTSIINVEDQEPAFIIPLRKTRRKEKSNG